MESPLFPGQALERIAWHTLEQPEVCQVLQVTPETGLSEAEVAQRREEFGSNEILIPQRKRLWGSLPDQIAGPLVLLLLACSLASFLLNRLVEGVALLIVALVDILPGLVMELRSSRANPGHPQLSTPRYTRVRRAGQMRLIDPRGLVPGDVIQLLSGDIVPADARLIGSVNLLAQEGPLTGEKHAVDKVPQAMRAENIPLNERHNLVFAGTSIVHGQGEAVVVRVGIQTELSRMTGSTGQVLQRQTPLGGRLEQLNNLIAACLLGGFAITLAIGSIRTENPAVILHDWSAMAVALIPEILPLMVALALLIARHRLRRQNALVRRPRAMETLGAVSVICTDQSGPLTEDFLKVDILDAAGRSTQFAEPLRKGYPILVEHADPAHRPWPPHSLLLAISALSSTHASLQRDGVSPEEFTASGDPTEAAILVAAAQVGLWKNRLERLYPRLLEAPYSAERRRRSALHQVRLTPHVSSVELPLASLLSRHNPFFIVTSGDPDQVLEVCDRVWINGHILAMSPERLAEAQAAATHLEKTGQRVSGIAFRPLDRLPALVEDYPFFSREFSFDLIDLPLSPKDTPRDVQASYELERELIFVGFQGIQEAARAESVKAVVACRKAGIRPIMFSAELPAQALDIARRLHVSVGKDNRVLTGQDLESFSPEELERAVEKVSIYSQLSPRHRVSIVQALQRQGYVVAVTGEEESDAPALSRSDVSAALATQQRQGALPEADLVLLDGGFASLMGAVEAGRQVVQRVQQFIRFSLSRSTALLFLFVFAPLLGMRSSPTPLQALWLNLACDALIGLPLVLFVEHPPGMRWRGLAPGEAILARGLGRSILWSGLGTALITLGVGRWLIPSAQVEWPTLLFFETVSIQIWLAAFLLFQSSWRGSKPRLITLARGLAVLLALAAFLAVSIHWNLLAVPLGLDRLPAWQLLACFASGALILVWQTLPGLMRRLR
jgi:P-type Ca2+ transporter type 2C